MKSEWESVEEGEGGRARAKERLSFGGRGKEASWAIYLKKSYLREAEPVYVSFAGKTFKESNQPHLKLNFRSSPNCSVG